MARTYRGLSSYEGSASADAREMSGGRIIADSSFTSTLQYVKPNRLKISFSMPAGGRSFFFDGTSLTVYQDTNQKARSTPVKAPTLRALGPALARENIVSRLDTLYFLAGRELPTTLTGFSRLPDETRNGRKVYVVTAREINQATGRPITWTWWIDQKSNLLSRIEGRITNVRQAVRARQGKKLVTKTILVNSLLTQNIIDPKADPRIDPTVFSFKAPARGKPAGSGSAPNAGSGR